MANEAKHTPGPWSYQTGEHRFIVFPASDESGMELICRSIRSEHDALLIAAAPELYEAAVELVKSNIIN